MSDSRRIGTAPALAHGAAFVLELVALGLRGAQLVFVFGQSVGVRSNLKSLMYRTLPSLVCTAMQTVSGMLCVM